MIDDIQMIKQCLQDEESRIIFDARYNYMLDHDYEKMMTILFKENEKYNLWDWNKYKNEIDEKVSRIVIVGAGREGKRTLHMLRNAGETVCAFLDNDSTKWGDSFFDVPICSVDEIVEKYENAFFIISVGQHIDELYQQLLVFGIPRKRIYIPIHRKFMGSIGNQYFDLPYLKHVSEEVFIDAGSYDLYTTKMFVEWCHDDYEKVFAFEPDKKCVERMRKTIEKEQMKNVEVLYKALSDVEGVLRFNSDGSAGGNICNSGDDQVEVTTIDNVLMGEKATFIKMDIEGSEYNAIKGAKNTIAKYHPKLAICLYHKPQDIVEIPKLILEIDSNYKFYIRHYFSCEWETVLYAI